MESSTTPSTPATEQELLRLDLQICFALHAASRAFGSVYRGLLGELGLTYPQYLVMLVLWEEGDTPVKKLGERLRLDSGTLSPLLKRLEAAELVQRERSTLDERSVVVRLTPPGRELRTRALDVPRRVGAATGLEVADMADLRDRLTALTRTLDASAAPGGDSRP